MRIFMLSWEYPPKIIGGIARHVQDLSRALSELGHEIIVFTSDIPNLPFVQWDHKVLIRRASTQIPQAMDFLTEIIHLNFAVLTEIIPCINSQPPDLIHVHDWLMTYAGRTLKFAYHIPLVSTIHATEYGRNNGLHTPLQRYISDMEWNLAYDSWKVICCSEAMKNEIQHVFQVPDDKINIIFNGVEPKNFFYEGTHKRSNYAADNEKIVFFIGRLVREKGVQVLLEAIPMVLSVLPQTKFIIAGTGPLAPFLHHRAEELKISHRIYFTGYIDDMTRNFLYKIANIAVFPSLYEPFGIVALESMAARTLTIVSDTGGLSSIIKHGYNGLKAYPGNPRSLTDNIIYALTHAQEMAQMINNGWKEITNNYNWHKIARQTEQLYNQILSEYIRSDWRQKIKNKEEVSQTLRPHLFTENQSKQIYFKQ